MPQRLTDPTRPSAYLLLTLTMLFWAGNHIVGRWAAGHVPPVTLAFLRWTGAAALVLPLAWPYLKRDRRTIRDNLPILALLGLVGTGLFNTLQYIALSKTTATSAAIINSAIPVLITAASFFLNGERVRLAQVAGILVSLTGVIAIMSKGEPASLLALSFNQGDLIMLGAAGLWAIYTVLLKKRPPIAPLSLAAVTYVIAAVLNAALAAVEVAFGATTVWSAPAVAAIAYVAVFPSFLAFLCFNRGVEIIGPARAGIFLHLVPLFTGLLAILLLGETPALYHAAGFALVFLGVWLAARGGSATGLGRQR